MLYNATSVRYVRHSLRFVSFTTVATWKYVGELEEKGRMDGEVANFTLVRTVTEVVMHHAPLLDGYGAGRGCGGAE
jgi:hypothetical protein